jgi:HK97 gp10 family phage protein
MSDNFKYESNTRNVKIAIENAIQKSLIASGILVEAQTKLLTPVRTGNLRNSYVYKVDNYKKTTFVGTNVEYAQIVEFGSSRRRAKPHLSKAFILSKNNVIEIFSRYLRSI